MIFAALFKRVRGFVLIELLDCLFLATTFTLLVIAISLPDQFIYYSGAASTSVAHAGTSGIAVNISSVNANVGAFYWRIGFSIPASSAMPGFSYSSELAGVVRRRTVAIEIAASVQVYLQTLTSRYFMGLTDNGSNMLTSKC